MSDALRYDSGKPRYDLIPPEGIEALAQVYTAGAVKYAPRNWEKGMTYTRCFASLMRHAWAWMRGQDNDQETGLPHMAHVAWNALAIVTYQQRGFVHLDDRPNIPSDTPHVVAVLQEFVDHRTDTTPDDLYDRAVIALSEIGKL